jgi:hypothetical protein
MKRKSIAALLLISLAVNLGLAYRVLDLSSAITDSSDEVARRDKQVRAMQKLLPAILANGSRVNLAVVAGNLGMQVLDKKDEGVYVDGVLFVFSGEQVSAVDFN